MLFFENQTLEPAAQRDFASRFGRLHVHPVYRHVEGVPEVTLIETRADSHPDNDNWHTDVTFIETPPFGAVLTPKVLPPSGGDTLSSSTAAAYNALSEPIRRLVDGLTAEHDFQHGFRRYLWGIGDRREAWEKAVAANPPVVHPVVRTLEDGRRGLFVNESFTSRIIELKPKESEALLAFLFVHIAKPEFTVRWLEARRPGVLGQSIEHTLRDARLSPAQPDDDPRRNSRRSAALTVVKNRSRCLSLPSRRSEPDRGRRGRSIRAGGQARAARAGPRLQRALALPQA